MTSTEHNYTNQLIHENSPYLLQHAHNPVNWYPWGQEALNKARRENKNILISIGYAACHWCHVMEHECFEDEEVAKYMNEHFVAIKVDREERPDIDQIYMTAVQLLTERGGWPLNCLTLPDGRPIYGGTYFPKAQWLDMLSQVSDFITKNPDKAEEQAKSLTEGIRNNEMIYTDAISEKPEVTLTDLEDTFYYFKSSLDLKNGGYVNAPKFPMPGSLMFLLHFYHLTDNKEALKAVTTTLNKMAAGGIYDQIGGGFSRYSTDEIWKVPHFEKMLYDNGQLVSLYAAAYQQTQNLTYKTVVVETLDFINRELTSAEGGFYSSLDADSEGVEGKFYVWTQSEIKQVLGEDAELIQDYYHVTEKGNWEKSWNILHKTGNDTDFAAKHNITESQLTEYISNAKQKLLAERSMRVRPALDDKILTSWNALMLKGYCDAYRAFDKPEYLQAALKNAGFLCRNLKSTDNGLFRNYKNGKASIPAFLDDYAFTIQAFISLYQVTFDEQWMKEALQLTEYAFAHFFDSTSGMFFYTSDTDPELIARKMEISDNVIPSSNSEMAKNLFILSRYYYNDSFSKIALNMLNNVRAHAKNGGIYYANWDILLGWFAREPFEIAIVGDDFESKRKEFEKHYLPHVFLSGGKHESALPLLEGKLREGETTIYVCQNESCKQPVHDVSEALKQI
ncbi:MAG: thioredoxin domain-containing protein [Paludibacter sp.]|nr:thioredoxin domain-containing protein [Paludibacter sp.]